MELHEDGRPILRFSLFEKWWRSKADAIAQYFPTEPKQLHTPWVDFGSQVAEALAQRPIPAWVAHLHIPEYDLQEYRIIEDMDGYLVRGTLDRYSTEHHRILDDKCAKTMWTPARAQKHQQLDFYSVLVEHRHGHVDNTSYIHCIPIDMDENGIVRLTGEPPVLLPHETTKQMRKDMRKKMMETAHDIVTEWTKYYTYARYM